MQHVEMLSSALGLLGAILLATRSRYAGLAFVAWFVSNIGWLIFGARHDHWFFFVQQIGFTATSVLGIWNWLVRPTLHPAETDAARTEAMNAMERLENLYGFECQGGPLANCKDWMQLKRSFETLAVAAEGTAS